MRRRTLGACAALAGLVVLVLSASADLFGIGRWSGVGTDQIVGMVLGGVMLAGGLVVARGSAKGK